MANKAIDRAYLVKALNTYNEQLDTAVVGATPGDITAAGGISTLTVTDPDGTQLTTVVPAINELDRKQGDAELTVVDTVAGETDPKDNLSDAVNTLDKEVGDCDTILVTDTVAGETAPKKEVVAALNVLDTDLGDTNTITVIDTTADPAKTTPEKEAVAAINVLDKELGNLADITVVDTVAGETEPKKVLVEAVNTLDKEMGDINTLTVVDAAGIEQKEVASAINQLDLVQGDDVLTVVDTKEGKTIAETTLTASVNVLDKELGENKDLDTAIDDKETIVAAINSVYKQGAVTIEESVPDPTDPDYKTVLKTYKFFQDFEADNVTPKLIGKINLAKDLVVTSGITYRADGTETWPSTGLPCDLEAGKVYIKLTIANQEDPIYIDVRDLYNDYTVEEDAERIQLAISDDRIISADVVPNSLKYTEFIDDVNKELRFTGFDHQIDTAVPEHYEICSDSSYGALLVVSGAPQGNQIALATVQAVNDAAGWGEHIEVGMYVVHKEAIPPGTPQLTTIAQNLREAVNELDKKQGDDVLTVVDTVSGETIAKVDLSAAVNVLDKELGDINTLTVAKADGTILKVVADAINQLDLVQGDDEIVVKDIAGTVVTTLTASVNALDDRLPVTIEVVPEEDLNPGIKAAYKVLQGVSDPQELGLIEIPYSNYEGEATDTVTVTVDNSDDHRVITADVNDESIGKQQLNTEVNEELTFLDKPTELTTTEKASVTKAINEVNLMKDVIVEEQVTPGPGVAKAFDIKQKDETGADVVKGTIEIPFSNYAGIDTATVEMIVDNTDGSRTISANVQNASIDHAQLTAEINGTLALVPEKITYKDSVSYIDFSGTYKDFGNKNDLYIITTDFTVGGKTYNAGSWVICTEVFASGERTWRYINNGGKSTIVRAITNPGDIREEYQEGKEVITDILNHQDDPMDTMYMIAVEQAGGLHAPHHGIYLKTGDIGQTAVAEIFDFGIGGGGGTYIGSHGTNIDVTITMADEVGTVAASINAGTLTKGLMDAEINGIFNFTGYPTALTTTAQTLAGGVNEHDAELGDIINAALEIKDGTKNNVADILKVIAKNNLTWEGTINATSATTTVSATTPMKKGYVFNVTGVESTINGIACKSGDWLVVTADVAVGAQPSFIKLGSSGDTGFDDAGPLIIFD